MGRNRDDDNIGCILMLIFLPFVLFFFIVKAFIDLCVKAGKKARNKMKDTQEYEEIRKVKEITETTPELVLPDNSKLADAVDEKGKIDLEKLTQNIGEFNQEIEIFLTRYKCAKCGKKLKYCKCKELGELIDTKPKVTKTIIVEKTTKKPNTKQRTKNTTNYDDMDDLEFDEMMDYWDELDAEDDDF